MPPNSHTEGQGSALPVPRTQLAQVSEGEHGQADTPTGTILAWGLEKSSGLVRHIRELPRERTGGASGIECVGCGSLLEAVNAGVSIWQHRPHFRHPKGTQRADCHLKAAKLGLLSNLTQDGVLQLPEKRRTAAWVGLSGTRYEAWRNTPGERVRIRKVSYEDRTRAIVTLDDGRRLAVVLSGEFSLGNANEGLALLTIDAGPDAHLLAGLTPEEIHQRLALTPDPLRWQCHWQDAELDREALASARAEAVQLLDEWPDDQAPPPHDRRRETLLHRVVREILQDARVLDVPGWQIDYELGDHRRYEPVPPHRLTLTDIRAERGLAGRVPDIQCAATAVDMDLNLPLLAIEVVVHHEVTENKLDELAAAGAAVLEISFAQWGGRLTREELRWLVMAGLDCKRWLHHPRHARDLADLEEQRTLSSAWREWQRHAPEPGSRSQPTAMDSRELQIDAEGLGAIAERYRHALTRYLDLSIPSTSIALTALQVLERAAVRADLWASVCLYADELEEAGVAGGQDAAVVGDLMTRLLSIYEDRGVGIGSQNARATINNVRTEITNRQHTQADEIRPSPTAALALLAFKEYELNRRNSKPSGPYDTARAIVRESLEKDEPRFLWDDLYLPLVEAMFPELANAIAGLRPRMSRIAEAATPRHRG